jgi:hypothetical protein
MSLDPNDKLTVASMVFGGNAVCYSSNLIDCL